MQISSALWRWKMHLAIFSYCAGFRSRIAWMEPEKWWWHHRAFRICYICTFVLEQQFPQLCEILQSESLRHHASRLPNDQDSRQELLSNSAKLMSPSRQISRSPRNCPLSQSTPGNFAMTWTCLVFNVFTCTFIDQNHHKCNFWLYLPTCLTKNKMPVLFVRLSHHKAKAAEECRHAQAGNVIHTHTHSDQITRKIKAKQAAL